MSSVISRSSQLAWIVLAILGLLLGPSARGADSTTRLVLAIHPYLPITEIYTRFTPLAEYLTKRTNLPVTVRVGRDYEEHIDEIGHDRVDVAFLGPVAYVRVVEKFGRKPLLAGFEVNHQTQLFGTIFTRNDAAIESLADLKGKRFAFGDPESTMSHVVPRFVLQQAGVPLSSLGRYQFLGSHKNVVLGVLAGDFDAGAVKKEVFDEFAPKGLKALATTPGVADHVFVTRSNLPKRQIDELRKAFLALSKEPQGASIMTAMHSGMTGLIEVSDADYDNLRPMVHQVSEESR